MDLNFPWTNQNRRKNDWVIEQYQYKYALVFFSICSPLIFMIIWASTRENLSFGGCEQHRRRPACALGQSDQRLCYSCFIKYNIEASYKRNFIFLASLCSWTGWLESHLVGNREDRFCREEAHTIHVRIWGIEKYIACSLQILLAPCIMLKMPTSMPWLGFSSCTLESSQNLSLQINLIKNSYKL